MHKKSTKTENNKQKLDKLSSALKKNLTRRKQAAKAEQKNQEN